MANSNFSSIAQTAPAHLPHRLVGDRPGPLDWAQGNMQNSGYPDPSSSTGVPAVTWTPTAPRSSPRHLVGNMAGTGHWAHSNTQN